jgi:very-short-patch-repair endonuclease
MPTPVATTAPVYGKPKYYYVAKRRVMTAYEEKFFRTLCEIFEDKCYVIPQVHLSALFDHKVRGQNWRGAFSHINGKSVDFVLCRRSDLSPLCAVELDDWTHTLGNRIERDMVVERIFAQAGLPLVRIKNPEALTKQELADEFARAINFRRV